MGVTIDKSRGNTIAEGVSVKSVTEGGSAALARSPRGVGLKLGKHFHPTPSYLYVYQSLESGIRLALIFCQYSLALSNFEYYYSSLDRMLQCPTKFIGKLTEKGERLLVSISCNMIPFLPLSPTSKRC